MTEQSMLVEMMESDELNEWVSSALSKMTDNDKRGVATMSVMIAMFQDFMSENPEVSECFQIYMGAENEFEEIH